MYRVFVFLKDFFWFYHGSINCKNIILQSIRSIGLWYSHKMYDIFWLAKLCILCFLVTNLSQMIALVMALDNAKKLYACFSVLSFCIMGFLKLWSLFRNERRWRSIIIQASSLENEQLKNSYTPYEYESDDENENKFSKHIDSYTKNFLVISSRLSQIYTFTAVVYVASPFLEYGIYLYTGQPIKNIPHILPGWYPLDRYKFVYIITVFIEMVAAFYCVRVHIVYDVTAIGLMIFIRGQFSCLRDYSERIGGKGKSCDISTRRDDRALYRIEKCHRFHVLLIKTIHELDSLIRNILGIYFFVAALTLCSVAVQLNSEHVSITHLISLLQYMGGTIIQLFLFCHYGNAVLNELTALHLIVSDNLINVSNELRWSAVPNGTGPFCSAFWNLSVSVRREIAILCVGMSRCYKISAGPFSSLNLPSFIQIIRTAYSYYAFLRQSTK